MLLHPRQLVLIIDLEHFALSTFVKVAELTQFPWVIHMSRGVTCECLASLFIN